MTTQTTPTINKILSDPSASDWLRDVLTAALQRDPVEVANDADLLAIVLSERCNLILNI